MALLLALPVELGTDCACRMAEALTEVDDEIANGAGNGDAITTSGSVLPFAVGFPDPVVVVVVVVDKAATIGIATISADMLVLLWMITRTLAVGDVRLESQDWTSGVTVIGIENDDPDTG